MHRLLLDTNILLDSMLPDRPGAAYARRIEILAAEGLVSGVVCAGSLEDVYYISRKILGDELAREFIRAFIDLYEVAGLDKATCLRALESAEPDFEDGIIRSSAELSRMDYILTRGAKAFLESMIPSMSARAYLESHAVS